MKVISLLAIIMLFLWGCKKEETIIVKEIPDAIIHTSPCSTLYLKTLNLFPRSVDNREKQAVCFSDAVQKNIVLTKETEVYLAMIDENAIIKNSIGWYTYDVNAKPQRVSYAKKNILFPNTSVTESGGKLISGDMLQIGTGKFKAGTVIGFFLVHNGWQSENINYGQPVLYTDYNLTADQKQQHILYQDTVCNSLVLSWEDTPFGDTIADYDYNDVVFSIFDNTQGLPSSSFDLQGVVKR